MKKTSHFSLLILLKQIERYNTSFATIYYLINSFFTCLYNLSVFFFYFFIFNNLSICTFRVCTMNQRMFVFEYPFRIIKYAKIINKYVILIFSGVKKKQPS